MRFEGGNKLLAPLCGKPVIAHSLENLRRALPGSDLLLVGRPEDRETLNGLARAAGWRGFAWAGGGPRRQDSARNGVLAALELGLDPILIHDAARPFVGRGLIEGLIDALGDFDAAIPGLPVRDTIKRVGKSGPGSPAPVLETPERSRLVAVQTPQAMSAAAAARAFAETAEEEVTDDATLVERSGGRVAVIEGSRENIKITGLEDIPAAEEIMKRWPSE